MKFITAWIFGGALVLSIAMAPVPGQTQQDQTVQGFPALAGIELTAEQQEQLTQIQKNTTSQIQAILTPQQQDKFKIVVKESQSRRQEQNVFVTLNLSEAQQTKLQEVFQSSGQQVLEILTPEQEQQIRQNMLPEQNLKSRLEKIRKSNSVRQSAFRSTELMHDKRD